MCAKTIADSPKIWPDFVSYRHKSGTENLTSCARVVIFISVGFEMDKLFTAGTSGKIFTVSLRYFFTEGKTEHPCKTRVISPHLIGKNFQGRGDELLNDIPDDVE